MAETKPVRNEAAPAVQSHQNHATTTNGLAVASMVVGIVAFISGWVPFWGLVVGIAAVVLGILALKKPIGKGMSIAGIVTGGLAALTSLFFTAFFILALVAGTAAIHDAQSQAQKQTSQSQQMIDAKKDFAKGETATFGTLEVKVNSVQPGYKPNSSFYQAGEGKEYTVVNVTVKNVGGDNEYISPYTFTVNDNGTSVDASIVTVDPELGADNLSPGSSTTGNIVYETTQGATNLKLQYETSVVDPHYQSKQLVYSLAI